MAASSSSAASRIGLRGTDLEPVSFLVCYGGSVRALLLAPKYLCTYLLALPWDSFLQKFYNRTTHRQDCSSALVSHTHAPSLLALLRCSLAMLYFSPSVRAADVGLAPLFWVSVCPHPGRGTGDDGRSCMHITLLSTLDRAAMLFCHGSIIEAGFACRTH